MIASSCLLGTAVVEEESDKPLLESAFAPLIPYCESHGWDEKGRWHFHADFALPGYEKLQEGELHDMMREIYPALLDLYHFYDAKFEMVIFLGKSTGKAFTLHPHILSMCASLGMAIDIFIKDAAPGAAPSHAAQT
ncbi:MAG: hypothetical protein EOP84_13400 [Verrucomicrobiaceae bacterium]|nr:MAG: hypothetical protein EOP84_13400 [Verrucomicrobiaceae bacterium]